MTNAVIEIYEALKDAGASEEKAKAAAKSVADYSGDIHTLKADTLLLKWMLAFNLTFTAAILWKTIL